MSEYCFASIKEIQKAYNDKKLSVKELVLSFLSRIAEIDKCKDGLNSVLEINPDAIAIAESLDLKMQGGGLLNGGKLPPLFGIPVLLKDNINTADRLHTSAGSVALAGNYAPYDAHIVKLLRKAGALILGKANMTEFANYMTRENMPSGYSSRGGQVINAYNRSITPSGSSSGSAVAVAAGLCTVSIGTETSGSILSPAAYNGIVGVKPSLGLVSRSGIIPISSTHDTAGPMARTVEDAAILLSVIAGQDTPEVCPADYTDAAVRLSAPIDYAGCLDSASLKGLRIGVNRWRNEKDEDNSCENRNAFNHLLKLLEQAGAILVDPLDIEAVPVIGKIMLNEFKACLNYYLTTLGERTRLKNLKDIIEYNQANASAALKYGQSILINAENNTSGLQTEPEYINALLEREKTIEKLDRLFIDNKIEILLCEYFTNIAPFTGFPAMTIPTGQREDKLPIGSYWIARRFNEAGLVRAACAAEKILGIKLSLLLCDQ